MSFFDRCFAAEDNLNGARSITLGFEADAYQGQELLLFLRANVAADDFESSRSHLVAFAEFIKKSFPLIAFDKTWHHVFPPSSAQITSADYASDYTDLKD